MLLCYWLLHRLLLHSFTSLSLYPSLRSCIIPITPSSRLSPQLKLFLITQPIIQLAPHIFSRLAQFFHQSLRFYNILQHFSLITLRQHTPHKHFKQNRKTLVKTKHQIQLTHTIKITIQRLHKQMNLLQHQELIGMNWYPDDKVQTCIPPVYKFKISLFNDIAHFWLTWENVGGNVTEDTTFFGFRVGGEEFRQADFTLS
mmetsp:Transcript_6510/g.12262  ORF Transcript_6510/g.12262 Transcript_6510/m.12262 type:complete len:200 (-) Transcript_6510:113-712(-)